MRVATLKKLTTLAIATVAFASLTLAGCSATSAAPKPNNSASSQSTAVSAELKPFYNQTVKWSDCGKAGTRCGTFKVPMDWANPATASINIAVAVHPGSDPKNDPYLLMNPGGPGGSGRDWITDYIDQLGTAKLRAAYNMVGFDPRGVGHSSAVKCLDAKAMDSYLYDVSPYPNGSAKDLAYSQKKADEFSASCKKNTGALLGFLDTVSAARDMDVIRAVLGQNKLNYLGYSYGSFLGTTYAALYPSNVGRFVLDGAIDPTITPEQDSVNQLVGFDSALRAYLADCLTGAKSKSCPFSGSVDQAMLQVKAFLSGLETKPLPTDDSRMLNVGVAITGMITPLYSKSEWTYLTQAFDQAFNSKRGQIFMALADYYNSRTNGKYTSNETEAFTAINCLDSRESSKLSDMQAQNKLTAKASVVFGPYWIFGGITCADWPYALAKKPATYTVASEPTIMVVGTTNDPATPFKQAQNLAHNILAHGWLLTYKGEGHTAYGSAGSSCVDNTVDDFLLNGKIPATEKTCTK